MFKRMLVVLVVLTVIVTVSGCRTLPAACDDVAGSLNFVAEKVFKPMAEKAVARDAEISADKLSAYHAKKASLYASYSNVEVE